jgi:hypothetical protein
MTTTPVRYEIRVEDVLAGDLNSARVAARAQDLIGAGAYASAFQQGAAMPREEGLAFPGSHPLVRDGQRLVANGQRSQRGLGQQRCTTDGGPTWRT